MSTGSYGRSAARTQLICSFENPREVESVKTSGARLARVERGATNGRYAVQVDFDSADRPMIELAPGDGNFNAFGSVALDVLNPAEEPLGFFVEVEDASGAKTAGNTGTNARMALPLRARERASFALPLNSPDPRTMGMRGEPAIPGFRLLSEDHNRVDTAHIVAIRLYLSKPGKPRSLILDNIRLAPGVSYDKIVDRYGQFAKDQWPGKLKSAEELKARLAKEEADLRLHPSLPERDEYGAWASGPTLQASGFFRVAKHEGRWWLVAPNGRLFFSNGLDCVTTGEGGTLVEGRESMFEWLPAASDPLAAHHVFGTEFLDYRRMRSNAPKDLPDGKFTGKAFNFYSANLQRKYGDDWKRRWQETILLRLRAWGVNTVGNWSSPALYDSKRIPYTVTLGIRGETGQIPAGGRNMRDTFDPRFVQSVEESVRAQAQARRDDPWCVGYFVDNELGWGNMRDERSRYGIALAALTQGADSAAKRAFAGQLQTRYGSIEQFNKAWNARFPSWDEFLAKGYSPQGELPGGMREDLTVFMKEYATRYFRTIRDALKKYDPNHLYLGSRFAANTREVVLASAESCDVVSFNIYSRSIRPTEPTTSISDWSILDGIEKPLIIGEFHMGALDRGLFHTGLVSTPDQAARAGTYQDYVRSVADHPLFVGCHFFKFVDEPLVGRPEDYGGENYNIGFVTVTDDVYPELVTAAKAVHAEVYTRHARAR